MRIIRPLLTVVGLAAIAYGAFYAISSLKNDEEAGAQHPEPEASVIDEFEKAIDDEREKPRFSGELLGIFIAPRGDAVPEGFRTFESVCGPSASTDLVPESQAGEFGMSLNLPSSYQLQQESLNTGVVACAGRVYAARWHYAVQISSTGNTADVVIVRSLFNHVLADVAADRVKATSIESRDVIVIEPLTTPNGISSWSAVIFPEPFGMTEIQAGGLPLDELLQLAESVAIATK
jgi:hypothetical protein